MAYLNILSDVQIRHMTGQGRDCTHVTEVSATSATTSTLVCPLAFSGRKPWSAVSSQCSVTGPFTLRTDDVSAAFGGASHLTVNQALAYAAGQSNVGGSSWYGQVKSTQGLAKNLFDAINNQQVWAP